MPTTLPTLAIIRRPGPGRPRSRSAHTAVLEAARKLLVQRGYAGVTMDGLARASGVGKPTIYRWWPSKGAIYRELYMSDAADFLGAVDSGCIEEDLRTVLRGAVRLLATGPQGAAIAGMFAEAQLHPDTFADFQSGLLKMREQGLMRTLRLAQERGELPGELDPALEADRLFGPILYRLLLRHGPIDEALADRLVDDFTRAWSAGPVGRKRRPRRRS